MKPSPRKHILCFSIKSLHLSDSGPFVSVHSSRSFLVSGQLQQIFLPLLPVFGCVLGTGVDSDAPILEWTKRGWMELEIAEGLTLEIFLGGFLLIQDVSLCHRSGSSHCTFHLIPCTHQKNRLFLRLLFSDVIDFKRSRFFFCFLFFISSFLFFIIYLFFFIFWLGTVPVVTILIEWLWTWVYSIFLHCITVWCVSISFRLWCCSSLF